MSDPKILLVDRNDAPLQAFQDALGHLLIKAVLATSVNSAISRCLENSFALIIIREPMTDEAGVLLEAILQGSAITKQIPVLNLPHSGDVESQIRAIQSVLALPKKVVSPKFSIYKKEKKVSSARLFIV
jgi:PleD family two-component response regulator